MMISRTKDMAFPSPAISTGTRSSSPKLTPGKPYLPMTNPNVARCASSPPASRGSPRKEKLVWVWTEDKQAMTAAVERGWDTFLFDAGNKRLADDWRSISLIRPLFVDNLGIFDGENRRVGAIYQVSSPQQLENLRPEEVETENLVVGFEGEWQVIPAENIVAMFQGCEKTVFAIATTSSEAQIYFEALEQGLGGIVFKAKGIEDILKLKDYLDRSEVVDLLSLTKATVKEVKVIGMGDRVCVDLCSLMQPGEGLLVGSFARGLFLVHSECLESNYIASRPFRVNAGPVHAYVAVPGGRTCYLSELKAGRHVIVADRSGLQRTVVVGRVKIESRQLILVEAEEDSESHTPHSIFLQNAETVGLVCPAEDNCGRTMIPVTSLKVGDKVLLRVQGGARHTGIEIQEFILER